MNKLLRWPAAVLALFAFLVGARTGAQQGPKWQIHEWGTFTSLQDEAGRAIGGINTDDEPVPSFVHSLFFPILPAADVVPRQLNKGLPSCHPDVTMRLETPVIYFHPPPGTADSQRANVKVDFRGGWLTQFYPNADADAPGLTNGCHFDGETVGSLEWDNLRIGGNWPLTNTTAHVWIAPRLVRSARVRDSSGEAEKFLFYRGVGHMDAPLRILRDAGTGDLLIHSQLENLPVDRPLDISHLWLVDIDSRGEIAFRTLPSITVDGDPNRIVQRTAGAFESRDYSRGNLQKLEASLKSALVAEGLFSDEAQALLSTWQVSYFKSPGMRVFFLCPREWTDYYLPLQISLPAQINRVMVGRIELVTPDDRTKLQQLAALSPARIRAQAGFFIMRGLQRNQDLRPVYEGEKPLSSVLSVPESYQTYIDLGRFRNALLLDEERKQPTPGLSEFIADYGLRSFPVSGGLAGS